MLTGWRLTVSKMFIIPQRVVTAIMGFLAVMIAYTIRTALSFAITKMVGRHSNTESALECAVEMDANDPGSSEPSQPSDFDWDEELQGFILASFYIGYVITHVPGGMFAYRFGGKNTLIFGMTVASVFTILTPVCVETGGAVALIALRIIIGMGEGFIFPSVTALLAAWVPLKERSKIGTLTYSGAQIGSIFGSLVSGALLDAYDGWGSVFYFFGAVGVLWVVLFALLVYSNPNSHPFVSEREKDYLQRELGQLEQNQNQAPIPFRHIITSPAVIALIFAQLGHNFGFFIIVTDLPKYMNDVLKFSIKENGLYSSLPYVFMWIVAQSTGYFSDILINKKYMSITNVRKLFTSVAAIIPGIFILGASYGECDRVVVVIMFAVGMGFMGCFYSGLKVNNLDLAPNYAGVIMAFTNGFGGFSGIFSPYIVGVLTPNSLMNEWRVVFWVTFVVFVVTTIIYCLWASGELQPWNDPYSMKSKEDPDYIENSIVEVQAKKPTDEKEPAAEQLETKTDLSLSLEQKDEKQEKPADEKQPAEGSESKADLSVSLEKKDEKTY